MFSKQLKIVFLVGGGALFGVILAKTNLQVLFEQIKNIGVGGAFVVMFVYREGYYLKNKDPRPATECP